MNINPTDLVDGRPSVVLGLIWTVILYFQVGASPIFHHDYRCRACTSRKLGFKAFFGPDRQLRILTWKSGHLAPYS